LFLDLAIAFVTAQHGLPAYGWLFTLLFLCGIGLPVAQDALLIAAAQQTLAHALDPVLLVVVAALGLVAGDALTFWTGRYYGARWVRRPWAARLVPPEKLPAMEDMAQRHAVPASFVTRFLIGQRSTLFFIAGTLRMPWRGFFIGDGVGAVVHVALLLGAVRWLDWRWPEWQDAFSRADDRLTLALIVLLLVLWLRGRRRV
jgi:membrane protein DedA with SNARE-associated domain